MQVYEIRILGAAGNTVLTSQDVHLSDQAAIRAGQRMANGKPFEVWRDLDCVHRGQAFGRKTVAANENQQRRV